MPEPRYYPTARALSAVLDTLNDYEWHTLADLASAAKCSEAGASARLRELRRDFGLDVERRREPGTRPRMYSYRLV